MRHGETAKTLVLTAIIAVPVAFITANRSAMARKHDETARLLQDLLSRFANERTETTLRLVAVDRRQDDLGRSLDQVVELINAMRDEHVQWGRRGTAFPPSGLPSLTPEERQDVSGVLMRLDTSAESITLAKKYQDPGKWTLEEFMEDEVLGPLLLVLPGEELSTVRRVILQTRLKLTSLAARYRARIDDLVGERLENGDYIEGPVDLQAGKDGVVHQVAINDPEGAKTFLFSVDEYPELAIMGQQEETERLKFFTDFICLLRR